jgi:hypothetical protein
MKQHVYTLAQLAAIQSGVYGKSAGDADLVYLQARHFDAHGHLAVEELFAELSSEDVGKQHLLQGGDVLFAAKGAKNFAALYEAHNQAAVASTTFFVIRLRTDLLIPAFLCWYLNHAEVLNKLTAKAKGSNVPAIAKSALEELDVYFPSLEKQHLIVKINQLQLRQQELQSDLLRLKHSTLQHQLLKLSYEHV